MNWSAFDFLLAGTILLVVAGLALLTLRRAPNLSYGLGVACAVTAAILLTVANGAVGIVGSEQNDVNLLFYVVPLVALVFATMVRFRARGMMTAMGAMAVIQLLVGSAAMFLASRSAEAIDPKPVIWIVGGLTMLWLASARFFRRAASH